MSDRNTLRHPIPPHFRGDGRFVQPVSRLDFRGDREAFGLGPDDPDDLGLLAPGLVVGGVFRYRWTGTKDKRGLGYTENCSQRLYMAGEYTGDSATVSSVPVSKYHPNSQCVDVDAPVFAMRIYGRLPTRSLRRVDVGRVAVACLQVGEPARLEGVDHAAVQEGLGTSVSDKHASSRIETVLGGGLFYATFPDISGREPA